MRVLFSAALLLLTLGCTSSKFSVGDCVIVDRSSINLAPDYYRVVYIKGDKYGVQWRYNSDWAGPMETLSMSDRGSKNLFTKIDCRFVPNL